KDYVYVSDVANAFVRALEAGERGIFHISTGKGTSVNKLFKALQLLTGDTTEPEYGPEREGDVREILLDNSAARLRLGWEPVVQLADGLRFTVDAARAARSATPTG